MSRVHPGLTPRFAYLVHFALVMSLAVITGVFWLIGDVVDVDLPLVARRVLRYGALIELVAAAVVVNRIRSTMSLQQPDADLEEWWQVNGGRVVTTWALAQASAVTGAALWLITGDAVILAFVVAAAVLLLLRLGPGHWVAEETHQSRLVP